MDEKKYYNFSKMKEILEIKDRTLSRWVNEGKIPFYRFGKKLFFKKIEIFNWMVERKGKKK